MGFLKKSKKNKNYGGKYKDIMIYEQFVDDFQIFKEIFILYKEANNCFELIKKENILHQQIELIKRKISIYQNSY